MTNTEAKEFWAREAEQLEAAFLEEVKKLGTPDENRVAAEDLRRRGKDARAAERAYAALIERKGEQ